MRLKYWLGVLALCFSSICFSTLSFAANSCGNAVRGESLEAPRTQNPSLIGKKVFVEITSDDALRLPVSALRMINSETGAVAHGTLISYEAGGTNPVIRLKIGGREYIFSIFVEAESATAFGSAAASQWTWQDPKGSVYRLRGVYSAEAEFGGDSWSALQTEIKGVVSSIAFEEEMNTTSSGKWWKKVLEMLRGSYAQRTWVNRETMKQELLRYIRRGDMTSAVGKFQNLFQKVEIAAVILHRLRPLHAALSRLAIERPEADNDIQPLKRKIEELMEKQADTLGWHYGDYVALFRIAKNIKADERTKVVSDAAEQFVQGENAILSSEALLKKLGIYELSKKHFQILYRDSKSFNSEDGLSWVTDAYTGETPSLTEPMPYAAMLPRKATVRRYLFDNFVSVFMNIVTHPYILDVVLKPVEAIPKPNSRTLFWRTVDVPRKFLTWLTDYLRDQRSLYIHGPGLITVENLAEANPSDRNVLYSAMEREASAFRDQRVEFLVSAARDLDFKPLWIETREMAKAKSVTSSETTEVDKEFYKDMLLAEEQAAKLGYLTDDPVNGVDFIVRAVGSYGVGQVALHLLSNFLHLFGGGIPGV